jgi:hypothetical protein
MEVSSPTGLEFNFRGDPPIAFISRPMFFDKKGTVEVLCDPPALFASSGPSL